MTLVQLLMILKINFGAQRQQSQMVTCNLVNGVIVKRPVMKKIGNNGVRKSNESLLLYNLYL